MFSGTQANLESSLLDSDSIVVSRCGQNFVLTTVQGKGNMVPAKPAKVMPVAKTEQQPILQRISKECGKFIKNSFFHELLFLEPLPYGQLLPPKMWYFIDVERTNCVVLLFQIQVYISRFKLNMFIHFLYTKSFRDCNPYILIRIWLWALYYYKYSFHYIKCVYFKSIEMWDLIWALNYVWHSIILLLENIVFFL